MNKTNYTSVELLKIIKQCGSSNVSTIDIDGLKISFDTQNSPYNRQEHYVNEPKLTDIPQSEYVDNFKEDDEIAMEADLESLYVTNPALAEEIELEQFNKDA